MATNDKEFESRIGKSAKVSGTLNFRAPVKIEGEVEGDISGDEIVITRGATVSARIAAARVLVAGTFSGELTATERVELTSTARVRCRLTTPSLILNEGAQFDGECRMPLAPSAAQAIA
jgi:cytoskeletal protein CcmA (bactofilin family)